MKQEFLNIRDIANDTIINIETKGNAQPFSPNCTCAELVGMAPGQFTITDDDVLQSTEEREMKITFQNAGAGTYFIGSTPVRK